MFASGLQGRGAGPNNCRVLLNAYPFGMNIAKGVTPVWPSNVVLDSNGYPTNAPGTTAASNPAWFPNYSGDIIWKFSGQVAIGLSGPVVVFDGGACVNGVAPSNTGDAFGGGAELTKFYNPGNVANPRVRFRMGWNIQSLSQSPTSNGAGGFLIRMGVKTGFGGNASTGVQVVISGQTGQAAATGTWTLTKIDNQTFDLQGSTWNVGDPYSGPSGLASIVNSALANIWFLPATSGAYSGFTNWVICKAAHEADIANGLLCDPNYVNQLIDLNNNGNSAAYGGILRFMDLSGTQASFESYYAQRRLPTDMSWSQQPLGFGVGAITRAAGDAYTCSNPSTSPVSGAPSDGEAIQGTVSATNVGVTPTLGITGRVGTTFPICLGNVNYPHEPTPQLLAISGPAGSAGQTMTLTFHVSWLNGGSTYTFNYVTVSGDTASANALASSLTTALGADATLSAGLIVFNLSPVGTVIMVMPPTALAGGALAIAYTAGPAVVSVGTLEASYLDATKTATFVFSRLHQSWMYVGSNYARSYPFEFMAELCNRTGMHCYFNWPMITTSSFVSSVAAFFAQNLNPGLRFMTETANEVWNSAANPYFVLQTFGYALGFKAVDPRIAYAGLRSVQYGAIARTAWTTAGRASTDYVVVQESQLGGASVGSSWDIAALRGTPFVTSNVYYGTYGGLNGTSESNRNVSGSRPGTATDAIGCAPYTNTHWIGSGSFTNAGQITGTVAQNAPLLQAALDYSNGLTAQAFASLVNQAIRVTDRASFGGSTGGLDFVDAYGTFVSQEAVAREYDAERIAAGLPPMTIVHYEGAFTIGCGHDGNNGVNSVNSLDISALATRIGAGGTDSGGTSWTGLNWTVSAYTHTGVDDKTEMATMIITLLQAWKNDPSIAAMMQNYYYLALRKAHRGRECHGAIYGYQASNWCLFPVSYQVAGSQYQFYNAIKTYNSDAGIH